MRILRNVLLCVIFVFAVFVSSANVQLVEIVYLPATGLASGWQPRSIQLPLFVIILGALGLGALLGGIAGLFEQGRLRLALRQSRKAEHKAAADLAAAEAAVAGERETSERLQRDLESARVTAERARRSAAEAGAPPNESLPRDSQA
jgi:uncharacterized integral membrane protein